MKRRNFLKAMLAVPLLAAVPALAAKKVIMGVDLAKGPSKTGCLMMYPDGHIRWTEYYADYGREAEKLARLAKGYGMGKDKLIAQFREARKNTKFKKPLRRDKLYVFRNGRKLYE